METVIGINIKGNFIYKSDLQNREYYKETFINYFYK